MRRRFLLAATAAATAFTATLSLVLTAPAASAGTGGGGDEHEPWVVRSAAQRTDAKAFRSLCGEQKEGRPERRTFPLFGRGKGFTAVQDFQRQDPDGTVYWGGHDPKDPENTISVSAIGACTEGPVTLSGVITIGFRQYAYQPLRRLGRRRHRAGGEQPELPAHHEREPDHQRPVRPDPAAVGTRHAPLGSPYGPRPSRGPSAVYGCPHGRGPARARRGLRRTARRPRAGSSGGRRGGGGPARRGRRGRPAAGSSRRPRRRWLRRR